MNSVTTKTKTQGDARLTCKNHPQMRWTKTKHSLPGTRRTFIGSGVLMFDGEIQEDGSFKEGFPLGSISERRLREEIEPEYGAHLREKYAIECDCPYGDLEFLEWID